MIVIFGMGMLIRAIKYGLYDLSKTHKYVPYTKEQFIDKIKTDDEFAKKWGELGPFMVNNGEMGIHL